MAPKKDPAADAAAEEEARLAEEAAAAEEARIKAREERLGNTLCFKDLDEDFTKKVLECEDPNHLLVMIGTQLGIHDYRENIRSNILIDFHLGNLLFAKESGMNVEQTSAFFSIMLRSHNMAIEDLPPMEKSFTAFKSLLLKHCLKNPPEYIDVFSPEQVEHITRFASRTYFQHFGLYQYAFTNEQEKDQYTTKLFVQTVMTPPPLASSVSSDLGGPAAEAAEQAAAEDAPKPDEAEQPPAEEEEKPAEFQTADGTVIPAELIEKMVNAAMVKKIEELKAELAKSMDDQNAKVLERIKRLGT